MGSKSVAHCYKKLMTDHKSFGCTLTQPVLLHNTLHRCKKDKLMSCGVTHVHLSQLFAGLEDSRHEIPELVWR
jgi:hypothetical protein